MQVNTSSKIYIAGHQGMVGSAIWKTLEVNGYTNLIGVPKKALDLRNQAAVDDFFQKVQPEVVIDAAAKVGGILANDSNPYSFLMDNLQIQNNLISAALQAGVQKFIFLGSSCIYPKYAAQPIQEEYLLTGALEPTNQSYAIAKIAGIKACEAIRKQYGKDYVSLLPTNLYGPKDNFHLETSHVVPAILRKFHEAKQNNTPVELWGTGTPLREFMFVDDLAKAMHHVLEHPTDAPFYNVGSGIEVSIAALAQMVQKVVGYVGPITWDTSKPDGTPRKLVDSSKIQALGWQPTTSLEEGIRKTYAWFVKHYS